MGRDYPLYAQILQAQNFNPRAPRGARHNIITTSYNMATFQSTRPSWGATVGLPSYFDEETISIHAPLVGRDHPCQRTQIDVRDFNPRAPRGARRRADAALIAFLGISIHAPLAGRDHEYPARRRAVGISIHAPLAGRD